MFNVQCSVLGTVADVTNLFGQRLNSHINGICITSRMAVAVFVTVVVVVVVKVFVRALRSAVVSNASSGGTAMGTAMAGGALRREFDFRPLFDL